MSLGFVKKKIKSGNGYRAWVSRNDTHGVFTMETIQGLLVEVLNEFPGLDLKDIRIEVSDKNNSMPNTVGIGFIIPESAEIPASYREYKPSYD